MTDEDSKARELDILTTEYKARRDEILMLSQRYGGFMMAVISLNSVIIVVGRFMTAWLENWEAIYCPSSASAPLLMLVAVPMLAYYLVASTMDAIHMLMLNGMRCGELEKAINRIAGKNLLGWETAVMGKLFWGRSGIVKYLWVQPNLLQAIFLCGLMGIATRFLTLLAQDLLDPMAASIYAAALWVVLGLVVIQWFLLVGPVRKHLAVKICDASSQQS